MSISAESSTTRLTIPASRASYLLLAFANIGLVPDAGATWLIAKAAGRAKVLEMALLGQKLPAHDAKEAGLVTHVVDESGLFDTAMDYARRLAAMPTVALGLMRRNLQAGFESSYAEAMQREAEAQRDVRYTKDSMEGGIAFLQKRLPEFRGE